MFARPILFALSSLHPQEQHSISQYEQPINFSFPAIKNSSEYKEESLEILQMTQEILDNPGIDVLTESDTLKKQEPIKKILSKSDENKIIKYLKIIKQKKISKKRKKYTKKWNKMFKMECNQKQTKYKWMSKSNPQSLDHCNFLRF